MSNTQPQATPEVITGIYRDAQEVLRISEERFNVSEQIEALDTEDPKVIAILEALGQLSTPNLARLSVGKPLVSYGRDYGIEGAEPKAVKSFLAEKRRTAQEGRPFAPSELAGLAIPMYLARKDEAAEDAAGSEPITVTRHSRALRGALTAHGPEDEAASPVDGPVTGTVDHADTKSGVLEVIPDPESAEAETIYQIQPVKTAGVNAGQVQVAIGPASA